MIADFFLKNPRLLLLTLFAIAAIGVSSFLTIPRIEDPILRRRVGVITAILPGANAEQVESAITKPIEEQLSHIAEIATVRSNTRSESVNVVIELSDEVNDTDAVWNRIRESMLDGSEHLPIATEVSSLEVFPLKAFASIVSIKPTLRNADRYQWKLAADNLRTQIYAINGTENVSTFGVPNFEVLVSLDPTKIASSLMTPGMIAEQISKSNGLLPQSAINRNEFKHLLSVEGKRKSKLPVDAIGQTEIQTILDDRPVALNEIANIARSEATPASSKALVDGEEAFVLGVLVQDSQRLDQWDDDFVKVLREFNAEFENFETKVIFSQRSHVDRRMNGLLVNLAISTMLVVFVTLLMMGIRASVVVATALPLSAFMVMGSLRMMEIPIHQISVTGLIVALGLLIDNAIVVVEDIRARVYSGIGFANAVSDSIKHLTLPLFGSTLTTVLAFLPIATMHGPSGEFVATLAISVILAITFSLIIALSLVPAMFAFLHGELESPSLLGDGIGVPELTRLYEGFLSLVYSVPAGGVLISILLPIAGFYFATQLPTQFFPATDRDQIQIEVELPADSTIARVERTVERIRKIVAGQGPIEKQHWFFGASAPTFYYNVVPRRRNSPAYAQAFLDTSKWADNAWLVRKLQEKIDAEILDARVIVRQLEQGPPFDAPIEIRVRGDELAKLDLIGEKVREVLSTCKKVTHTRADLSDRTQQYRFQLDDRLASENSLTEEDVANFVYSHSNGISAGTVFENGIQLPVRVKSSLQSENVLAEILALPIVSEKGDSKTNEALSNAVGGSENSFVITSTAPAFPTLADLGSVKLDAKPAAINRIDGQRVNEVKAYLDAGVLPSSVLDEFREKFAASNFEMPKGYRIEFGGEEEKRTQAVEALIGNAILLFALMLLTLVAIFRSFRAAFVIASVGGLTIGLGPLSLYLFGYPFGFMAIVGTMGLVGIAINDSIVVLAALREAEKESDAVQTPKLMATTVSRCTRHVLATTVTTIVGFMPLVLYGGEFWAPLAICICGGVAGATLLALIFAPSAHRLLWAE